MNHSLRIAVCLLVLMAALFGASGCSQETSRDVLSPDKLSPDKTGGSLVVDVDYFRQMHAVEVPRILDLYAEETNVAASIGNDFDIILQDLHLRYPEAGGSANNDINAFLNLFPTPGDFIPLFENGDKKALQALICSKLAKMRDSGDISGRFYIDAVNVVADLSGTSPMREGPAALSILEANAIAGTNQTEMAMAGVALDSYDRNFNERDGNYIVWGADFIGSCFSGPLGAAMSSMVEAMIQDDPSDGDWNDWILPPGQPGDN